jgi:hypothetical protein
MVGRLAPRWMRIKTVLLIFCINVNIRIDTKQMCRRVELGTHSRVLLGLSKQSQSVVRTKHKITRDWLLYM